MEAFHSVCDSEEDRLEEDKDESGQRLNGKPVGEALYGVLM